jgi:hypothetical protein
MMAADMPAARANSAPAQHDRSASAAGCCHLPPLTQGIFRSGNELDYTRIFDESTRDVVADSMDVWTDRLSQTEYPPSTRRVWPVT